MVDKILSNNWKGFEDARKALEEEYAPYFARFKAENMGGTWVISPVKLGN